MTAVYPKQKLASIVLLFLIFATFIVRVPTTQSVELASVIVQGFDLEAATGAVEDIGGRITAKFPIINGLTAEVAKGAIPYLMESPAVFSVTPNEAMTLQGEITPSPLHDATAEYPRVIGADQLWKSGVEGTGVGVAVIDTGISKVTDLGVRVIGGIDLSGEGDPYKDSFGHGTFIAGLIAGNGASSKGAYKGVAPKTNLVSVKIAGANGASDVSHVLAAIQWVVSFKDLYGIRVINLSLGTNSTQPYRYSPLNYAVQRAWDAGIVVVVSASNAGPAAKTIAKPGDDPLVITVGAVDDRGTANRGDDMMAGFSGVGPTAADGLLKPDVVASGRSVVSLRSTGSSIDTAYPGSRIGTAYFRGSGTSFSTAITAGTAALMLQKEPALNPNQVKHRMISKAAPGPVGNRNVDGYGSLDAYAAATAGTLTEANQGVARSYGSGKMGDTRGLLKLSILVPKEDCGGLLGCLIYGVLDTLTGLVRILLSGEKTAKNTDFDSTQYRGTWDGARWYTSQWAGGRWYATEWEGARWYGARWYSTDWYGARWYAIAWE